MIRGNYACWALGLAVAMRLAWTVPVPADEPAPADSLERNYAEELPRIAPLEPRQALDSFVVQAGLHLELAAAEPQVTDPTALAFDEDGRLYVVEMRGYSEEADEALSRIRRLEDLDGDGYYEQSVVFVQGLSWPTAVTCWDGGVFVGIPPDLWYFRDTTGDGVADERRVVLTGFGISNVQGLLNSFQWGLDHRIHIATSSTGGAVRRPEEPESEALELRGRNLAYDPRTGRLELTSGASQHGMTADDWGQWFVCHNSDHLQQIMFEDRYLARNPYLAAPSSRQSIAADGPQAEVFRISPIEPWRIVRTRLRAQGIVPGVVEGGGRAGGYFTSATGVTVYRGDAWPAALRGQVIVGDVGSNIVHRKVLDRTGIQFVGRRVDEGVELVASTDNWFRPVQYANAPDGTLYIADMYREVIEHPLSLPPIIKQHLDLTSGRDRGRVYRLAPAGFTPGRAPRLSQATSRELVRLLAHTNGWHRDTAARLLATRQDAAICPDLEALVRSSANPLARLHALHALEGQGALREATLLAALGDSHPGVLRHAVRLAEGLAQQPAVAERLCALANHDDLHVRYQLAFTLGELPLAQRAGALAKLAQQGVDDPWLRLAVLSSLGEGADLVYSALAEQPRPEEQPGVAELLADLARQLGRQRNCQPAWLDRLDHWASLRPELARQISRAWIEGLARSGASPSEVRTLLGQTDSGQPRPAWQHLIDDARHRLADTEAPVDARVEAIALLSAAASLDGIDLRSWVDRLHPQALQLAALTALEAQHPADDAELTTWLAERWAEFTPSVQRRAAELWIARRERALALLDCIAGGTLAANQLDPTVIQQLRSSSQDQVRQRAEEVLATALGARRADVIEAYRPALALEGNVERGRQHFRRVCAACHKLEGVGHELGPALATIKSRGPEGILINLLDPSREVNPQYLNYLCVTSDGRSTSGMITAESANSVTLTRAEGAQQSILRVEIDELRSTGLSLMPEGLEQQLDPQAVADLIAYLLAAP